MNGRFFADRRAAGKKLAAKISREENSVVLALPRGGVPVAFEVAQILKLPLDILAVKKIGAPSQPEFALGAISEDGVPLYQEKTLRLLNLQKKDLAPLSEKKFEGLKKQLEIFRKVKEPEEIKGRNIILVDDGVATGASMQTAIRILKNRGSKSIMVAVPVIAPEAKKLIEREVDTLITLYDPDYFDAVGSFYTDFRQVENEEVAELLRMAKKNIQANSK